MKIILKSILTVILLAAAYTISIQGISPIYEDAEIKPFSGDSIFNPYAKQNFSNTVKANFHAHTKFDTREPYTEGQFEKVYFDNGYDYIGVSNHNFITNSLIHRDNYIPTYEHGWNLNNYHILVINAKQNDLLDNPFMIFPCSQMQWMIDNLRNDAPILSLNHPERLRFANKKNYQHLRGYDLLEANGNNDRSVWDDVLMQGCYIPLLSNDDAHSITNIKGPLQRAYTVVLSNNTSEDILTAIKAGRSYGVVGRRDTLGQINPKYKAIDLKNDTLWVRLDLPAKKTAFISNGKEIFSAKDTNFIALPAKLINNYVRVEAIYDSVILVSNPIVRSQTSQRPKALPVPEIDKTLTAINSSFWGICTLIVIVLIFKLWIKRKKHSKRKSDNFENYTWGIGMKHYDPS